METLAEHKAIVKHFIQEAFEKFNGEAMDDLLTKDFHAHPWESFGIPDGPEGMKQVLAVLGSAFSKAEVAVNDMIAEGDKVVVRYTFAAAHTGELMGIGATGKRISMPGILIARIEGDKLAEYWREEDLWGMMQQLGALPVQAV